MHYVYIATMTDKWDLDGEVVGVYVSMKAAMQAHKVGDKQADKDHGDEYKRWGTLRIDRHELEHAASEVVQLTIFDRVAI